MIIPNTNDKMVSRKIDLQNRTSSQYHYLYYINWISMAITIFNQNLTTLQQTVTHNFTHIQAGQLYMVGYKGKIVE